MKQWAFGAFQYPQQKPWNRGLKVLNYELIQASFAARRHCDWHVSGTHPPPRWRNSVCLYICLSSLPQSLPRWCYLRVCVSVGRRWRSVWLNPDKETNSSGNRPTERGEGRRRGWGGGSTQNKTDKGQNAKTRLRTLAVGVLLHLEQPSFFRYRLYWNTQSQSVTHTNEDQRWWPVQLTSYQSH